MITRHLDFHCILTPVFHQLLSASPSYVSGHGRLFSKYVQLKSSGCREWKPGGDCLELLPRYRSVHHTPLSCDCSTRCRCEIMYVLLHFHNWDWPRVKPLIHRLPSCLVWIWGQAYSNTIPQREVRMNLEVLIRSKIRH